MLLINQNKLLMIINFNYLLIKKFIDDNPKMMEEYLFHFLIFKIQKQ